MTRKEKIIRSLDLTGSGLELGPLCWPVVTKDESDIYYVDHMSTEDLKKKYKGEKVPLDEIVDVDYALGDRTLPEAVGTKKFDYVIASHVIEHIPDMVRWFEDVASVLKPGGVLSLVIPDKRYTFDIDRNETRPADVVGAYVDALKRPYAATMFDFTVEYRQDIVPTKAWDGELYLHDGDAPHRYVPEEALAMSRENLDPETYVDSHCHVLTPRSLFAVLTTLSDLGLLPFKVASFTDTEHGEYEFFVALQKTGPGRQAEQKRSIPVMEPPMPYRALEARLAAAEQELQAMRTSRSWRVTKPLRTAAGKARGAKPKA